MHVQPLFGTVWNQTPDGVLVYSNQGAPPSEEHVIDGVFMGMKWQCVELARRHLVQTKHISFESIECAYELFRQPPRFFDVRTGETLLDIEWFSNNAVHPPRSGSLLVWDEPYADEQTGHVAVVTNVSDDQVTLMEQNAPQAVRTLPLCFKSFPTGP